MRILSLFSNAKYSVFFVLICSVFAFTACKKDGVARITVTQAGVARAGVTVYMFHANTASPNPTSALEEETTNASGVTTFELDREELDGREGSFLFVVFANTNTTTSVTTSGGSGSTTTTNIHTILGQVNANVRKGRTTNETINIAAGTTAR